MKVAIATIMALGLLMLTVLEAEAAVDPNALKQSFSCADIQKASSKMAIFAQNIENKDTTRTAEGGAYKRLDVTCHELFCETQAKTDFKLMYMPSHPDANGAGYVQFPRVDVPSQYASLTSAAAEVRLLAESKTCGATSLGNATMAMIKYGTASTVQQDTLSYSADGRLAAWTRTLKDGTSKSYAFAQDGSVIK